MTIDAHVVQLAVEYLDTCVSAGTEPTLVGMHWYIDGRNKTTPLLDEVNQALRHRPGLFVARQDDAVVFSRNGSAQSVTADDMKLADRQYRSEFSAKLRHLRGDG